MSFSFVVVYVVQVCMHMGVVYAVQVCMGGSSVCYSGVYVGWCMLHRCVCVRAVYVAQVFVGPCMFYRLFTCENICRQEEFEYAAL